jgi:hypothetical protein
MTLLALLYVHGGDRRVKGLEMGVAAVSLPS